MRSVFAVLLISSFATAAFSQASPTPDGESLDVSYPTQTEIDALMNALAVQAGIDGSSWTPGDPTPSPTSEVSPSVSPTSEPGMGNFYLGAACSSLDALGPNVSLDIFAGDDYSDASGYFCSAESSTFNCAGYNSRVSGGAFTNVTDEDGTFHCEFN